ESGFDIDLKALLRTAVQAAIDALAAHPPAKPQPLPEVHLLAAEVFDFILERLRGYYADKGVAANQFNAVAALFDSTAELPHGSLYDFDRRIDAVGTFATLPEAEALAAANKRIRNILRKAEGVIPDMVDPALLREPAEESLAEAVE